MPYPNEHAARIAAPGSFDRMRRVTDKFGPGIDVIYGIKAGKPVKIQAIRFSKDRFTAAQARAWLKEHNHDPIEFEPASEPRANVGPVLLVNEERAELRRETVDGHPFLIVPAIMLVEGVHAGVLYPAEDISAGSAKWNGTPVVLGHPYRGRTPDGRPRPVSVRSPGVLESTLIGVVQNARWDGKLRADLWLREERLSILCPEILTALRNNQAVELSTGLFTDDEEVAGVWGMERYRVIARNHEPDHLALLEGKIGACSLADGCGAMRTNQLQQENAAVLLTLGEPRKTEDEDMAGKMYRIEVVGNDARMEAIRTAADLASLKLNEQSFGEVESAIQRKLNAMDSADSTYWCVAVFPDDVVYRVSRRLPESPSGTPVRSTECMYRVNYSVSAEGEVTFTGEPVEVRLEKTYVPVEQAGNREPTVLSAPATGSPTEGQERETEMAKKDLIDELIGCECTRFKANDRAFLETMTEDQLGLLRPVDPPPAAAATPPEVKVNEEPAAKPEVKPEPPAPKVLSADEYVAQAPPEVAGILRRALDAEKAEKAEIVKQLMANESNPFPQADLEKRDLGELKALAALGRVNVRFTGRGGGAPPEPPKRPGPPRMPSIFEAKTA